MRRVGRDAESPDVARGGVRRAFEDLREDAGL